MANLAKAIKTSKTLESFLQGFKNEPRPVSVLEAQGKTYLALGLDSTSGFFLVLSISDTSKQCRITLQKLSNPQVLKKYSIPKKLAAALPVSGWKPSKNTENSYFLSNDALHDSVQNTYMKKAPLTSLPSITPEDRALRDKIMNSPVLGYTLEKALALALEKKTLKGLTLWPTKDKGWQGNAQNAKKGWSVIFDKDPVKALLGALAGNIGV